MIIIATSTPSENTLCYGVFQGCTTRDGTGGDTGNDTRILLGVVLGVVQGEV